MPYNFIVRKVGDRTPIRNRMVTTVEEFEALLVEIEGMHIDALVSINGARHMVVTRGSGVMWFKGRPTLGKRE